MAKMPSNAGEAELEALQKRSAELIAEVEQINRRANEHSAAVLQSPTAPFEPAITDTWVDAQRLDVSIPDELP